MENIAKVSAAVRINYYLVKLERSKTRRRRRRQQQIYNWESVNHVGKYSKKSQTNLHGNPFTDPG